MTSGRILTGLILISIGILFILDNINWIDLDFGTIWPLILIFVGLFIILKGFGEKKNMRNITSGRITGEQITNDQTAHEGEV
jgi:uncharacterized membrane protein